MITLKNLDKRFNKKRGSSLHVINDTTLEFPNNGLVTLLGKSGSGKTTLLNVIGGLDKPDKGTIDFFGKEITKYHANKWDSIRSKDIGYIFQNYYLMPNLTVYENVAYVLKMIGLSDEDEINNRVTYVLKSVGLYQYRKKKALQLSGGQQQRVAIARAIVKNPKVIIADEPTGNLDTKNTVEVMNIIKEISKEKLVIWVTHELEIANIYSDRIINIKDGKVISDEKNEAVEHHNLDVDDAIYLKDLNQITSINDNNLKAEYYTDSKEVDMLSVKLVIKNETIYISIPDNNKRVVLINQSSPIKLVNDSYKPKTKTETLLTQFDTKELSLDGVKLNKKLNFSFKKFIKGLVIKFSSINFRKKLIILSLIFSGFLLSLSSAMIAKVLIPQDSFNILSSENLVKVSRPHVVNSGTIDTFKTYLNDEVKANKVIYTFNPESIYLTYGEQLIMGSDYTEPYEPVDEKLIIFGRKPENENEIMISENFDGIGKHVYSTLEQRGIWDNKYLLNENVKLQFSNNQMNIRQDVKITGIVKGSRGSVVYMDSNLMLKNNVHYIRNQENQKLVKYTFRLNGITDKIRIISGRVPLNANEIIIPSSFSSSVMTNLPNEINGLFVVGVYDDSDDYFNNMNIIVYTKDKSTALLHSYVLSENSDFWNLLVKTEDNNKFVDTINNGLQEKYVLKVTDINTKIDKEYRDDVLKVALPVIAIIVSIALLGFYFLNRTSVINQIYNISVLRSLGVKKIEVAFSFILEVLFIVTISAFPGYLLGTYFATILMDSLGNIPLYVTGNSIILGLLTMYFIFIVIGVLPIWQLLRKTPSQISSKYDM